MSPDASPATCLLNPTLMESTLARMAREMLAALAEQENPVIIGIRSRGLILAERLGKIIQTLLGKNLPVGALDITLYRDDLVEKAGSPIVRPTEIPFSLKDNTVFLVDDVIFTGRTIRAALDALLDHGRPRRVILVELVDRGGRDYPIQPDIVGLTMKVPQEWRVSVKVIEIDKEDGVFLEGRGLA